MLEEHGELWVYVAVQQAGTCERLLGTEGFLMPTDKFERDTSRRS
jgi:hypothetical protein